MDSSGGHAAPGRPLNLVRREPMGDRLRIGFAAGVLGAIILIVLMYLMEAFGITKEPSFVSTYRYFLGGDETMANVLGAILFALSGGIWGLIYGALVANPTVGNGMLFGFLPSLWVWLVLSPMMGKPIFGGFAPMAVLLPIIFNVMIWGSFLGWYCRMRKREETA